MVKTTLQTRLVIDFFLKSLNFIVPSLIFNKNNYEIYYMLALLTKSLKPFYQTFPQNW